MKLILTFLIELYVFFLPIDQSMSYARDVHSLVYGMEFVMYVYLLGKQDNLIVIYSRHTKISNIVKNCVRNSLYGYPSVPCVHRF